MHTNTLKKLLAIVPLLQFNFADHYSDDVHLLSNKDKFDNWLAKHPEHKLAIALFNDKLLQILQQITAVNGHIASEQRDENTILAEFVQALVGGFARFASLSSSPEPVKTYVSNRGLLHGDLHQISQLLFKYPKIKELLDSNLTAQLGIICEDFFCENHHGEMSFTGLVSDLVQTLIQPLIEELQSCIDQVTKRSGLMRLCEIINENLEKNRIVCYLSDFRAVQVLEIMDNLILLQQSVDDLYFQGNKTNQIDLFLGLTKAKEQITNLLTTISTAAQAYLRPEDDYRETLQQYANYGLRFAILSGDQALAKLFISLGGDIFVESENIPCLLDLAPQKNTLGILLDSLKYSITAGANSQQKADAVHALAKFYYDGRYVTRDLNKAAAYFNQLNRYARSPMTFFQLAHCNFLLLEKEQAITSHHGSAKSRSLPTNTIILWQNQIINTLKNMLESEDYCMVGYYNIAGIYSDQADLIGKLEPKVNTYKTALNYYCKALENAINKQNNLMHSAIKRRLVRLLERGKKLPLNYDFSYLFELLQRCETKFGEANPIITSDDINLSYPKSSRWTKLIARIRKTKTDWRQKHISIIVKLLKKEVSKLSKENLNSIILQNTFLSPDEYRSVKAKNHGVEITSTAEQEGRYIDMTSRIQKIKLRKLEIYSDLCSWPRALLVRDINRLIQLFFKGEDIALVHALDSLCCKASSQGGRKSAVQNASRYNLYDLAVIMLHLHAKSVYVEPARALLKNLPNTDKGELLHILLDLELSEASNRGGEKLLLPDSSFVVHLMRIDFIEQGRSFIEKIIDPHIAMVLRDGKSTRAKHAEKLIRAILHADYSKYNFIPRMLGLYHSVLTQKAAFERRLQDSHSGSPIANQHHSLDEHINSHVLSFYFLRLIVWSIANRALPNNPQGVAAERQINARLVIPITHFIEASCIQSINTAGISESLLPQIENFISHMLANYSGISATLAEQYSESTTGDSHTETVTTSTSSKDWTDISTASPVSMSLPSSDSTFTMDTDMSISPRDFSVASSPENMTPIESNPIWQSAQIVHDDDGLGKFIIQLSKHITNVPDLYIDTQQFQKLLQAFNAEVEFAHSAEDFVDTLRCCKLTKEKLALLKTVFKRVMAEISDDEDNSLTMVKDTATQEALQLATVQTYFARLFVETDSLSQAHTKKENSRCLF